MKQQLKALMLVHCCRLCACSCTVYVNTTTTTATSATTGFSFCLASYFRLEFLGIIEVFLQILGNEYLFLVTVCL